eukprot:GILI01003737.1.p1 GENE.GILI01003737.1~~GILI01003737.1.p1  ORF type:complete len:238 (+),score=72.98 GILI01003737.1:73-786(+)
MMDYMRDVFKPVAPMQEAPHEQKKGQWSPYVNNGGTCVAVAGKSFCVIAADTRMSVGYSINTRVDHKITQLTDKCVIATSGMSADAKTLHKLLKARLQLFHFQNNRMPSTPAIAQMLSNILYGRRFFPYYTFNVLAGVDDDGVGCVFSYDAIGSFERIEYGVTGSGSSLMLSVLDNQVAQSNQLHKRPEPTLGETVDIVKDCITSAGERDIYTGDFVDIYKITPAGIEYEKFDLKLD